MCWQLTQLLNAISSISERTHNLLTCLFISTHNATCLRYLNQLQHSTVNNVKFTAFAVAAALAATTVISADTRALRALTDVTATEAMQPTADAPKEDDDQNEMGWEHRGWGHRGWGHAGRAQLFPDHTKIVCWKAFVFVVKYILLLLAIDSLMPSMQAK
ncbi:hypothetical protein KXD40_006301 [Peronospora effusa]|nr:hypothetical protein KXD40_006301 [Peronospora effusa]